MNNPSLGYSILSRMEKSNQQEAQELLNHLRSKGYSDKDLAKEAYLLFVEEKMSFAELKALLKELIFEEPKSLKDLSEEELREKLEERALDMIEAALKNLEAKS